MTHPITLWHALKDAGMSCRAKEGRLLINPVALLQGELRELVISHRADLLAWLEGAEEDEARMDAIALEAARFCPFDDNPGVAFGIRQSVLVRVSGEGEPPKYVAMHPDYWTDLERWARESKEANAKRADEKAKKATRKKGSRR